MIVGALAAAAAVLLAVAGLAKLRTPGPAAAMIVALWPRRQPLRQARMQRQARMLARAAGLVEVGGGVATLAFGGRVALSVLAACYLVVAVLALRLATGPQHAACGCFGAADGVVGPAHVILDFACLGVAGWALARPPAGLGTLFEPGMLTGFTSTAQVVLLASLGYLSITALPALSAARRSLEGSS